MNLRAFWKYYLDLNLYNLVFSLFFLMTSGPGWALFVFCSFGIFASLLGFRYFKRNEYYMYYNLGITRTKLILKVWLLNIVIAAPVYLIILLLE